MTEQTEILEAFFFEKRPKAWRVHKRTQIICIAVQKDAMKTSDR